MLQEYALTEQAVRESVCDEPDLRQGASSFGSNTTHLVPRYSDSSMNCAVRRTEMYLPGSSLTVIRR